MEALWSILLDLIVLLSLAMLLGVIAQRLKQSAVVGYMLAGVLVANVGTPLDDMSKVETLAQLGVILLMFTIGLEFNWSRLKRLGLTALTSGSLQIGLTIVMAVGLGMLFLDVEQKLKASFAIGAALALSSTAVVLPVLQKRSEADTVHGRFALGVLLVQDLAVVPLVLIVGALGTAEGAEPKGAMDIVLGTLKGFGVVGLFVLGFFVFSKYILPVLVRVAVPSRNRDVLTLFGFLMAMGSAWLSQQVGISPALGALLAAIFLGESILAPQLRGDVTPLKTVFVTLFFSSIGMYLQLDWFFDNIVNVLVLTGLVVTIKPTVVFIVGLIMKLTPKSATAAGCSMSQVGLFSFVLATIAEEGRIIEADHVKLIVSATILTLFLTPYTVAAGIPLGMKVERFMRNRGWTRSPIGQEPAAQKLASGHIIVVGYGPAGREVVRAAQDRGLPVVVLDLNPASVIEARKAGIEAYVGDASQQDILKLARFGDASAMVITLPDHRLTTGIIVEAKALSNSTRIIARARYHRYFGLLEGAGADIVVDEEKQVGRRLSDYIEATSGESESQIEDDDEKDEEKTS